MNRTHSKPRNAEMIEENSKLVPEFLISPDRREPAWQYHQGASNTYRAILGPEIVLRAYAPPGQESPEIDGSLPTAGDVVLALTNGRYVRIHTSEWGGLNDFTVFAVE